MSTTPLVEIVLEDVGRDSFWDGLLRFVVKQAPGTFARLVAVGTDTTGASVRIESQEFGFLGGAASADLTGADVGGELEAALSDLRDRLTEAGWVPTGDHGSRPWSYRYTRTTD